MEADTTFVRADGIVVLYTVTHIGAYVALVISPCYTELIYTIGDAEAFDEVCFVKFGVLVVLFFDGTQNLFYCLMILGLIGEASFQIFQNFCCIHNYFFY